VGQGALMYGNGYLSSLWNFCQTLFRYIIIQKSGTLHVRDLSLNRGFAGEGMKGNLWRKRFSRLFCCSAPSQSKCIEKKGEQLSAVGTFTMHGVTKEIALPFTWKSRLT
jgi:hypothetical protein